MPRGIVRPEAFLLDEIFRLQRAGVYFRTMLPLAAPAKILRGLPLPQPFVSIRATTLLREHPREVANPTP